MIRFKDIRMKQKLIGMFLFLGLIPLALSGIWNSYLAKSALMEKSHSQLEAVRNIKKAQIEKFFDERKGDMAVLVEIVSTLRKEAFDKLEAVQEIKKARLIDYFETMKAQLRILKDDPYVMNAMIELEEASEASETGGNMADTPEWNTSVRKYDHRMKDIMKDNGWYDISSFIITVILFTQLTGKLTSA